MRRVDKPWGHEEWFALVDTVLLAASSTEVTDVVRLDRNWLPSRLRAPQRQAAVGAFVLNERTAIVSCSSMALRTASSATAMSSAYQTMPHEGQTVIGMSVTTATRPSFSGSPVVSVGAV